MKLLLVFYRGNVNNYNPQLGYTATEARLFTTEEENRLEKRGWKLRDVRSRPSFSKKNHLSRLYHFTEVGMSDLSEVQGSSCPRWQKAAGGCLTPDARLRHPAFNQERLLHRWTRRISACPIRIRHEELLLHLAVPERLPHRILHDLSPSNGSGFHHIRTNC